MKKLIFLLVFVIIGCTSKNTSPEGALINYIDVRFSGEIDIKKIGDFFIGPMLDKLNGLGEEELNVYFKPDGLKKRKVSVLSKSCEQTKCFLTYIISYDSDIAKDESYQSKVKKVVELWKEDGVWKIASINNIKTYHKSDQAINALE